MIEPMKRMLKGMKEGGRDRLFWGAPALIIITAKKDSPGFMGARDNACLTADHVMLMAETMGLGTCSLGLLTGAIAASRKTRKLSGIPKGHRALYALAIGKKDTNFKKLVPRNKPKINFVE